MQKLKRIPMTQEGFDSLKFQLSELQKQRPQAVKNLSEARAMGDLSENGLYTAAKARLRSIDSQLFRLDMQIKLAEIIKTSGEVAGIGSHVTVLDGKDKRTYSLVGDLEANPKENKISQNSPLGKSLIGKKKGETVSFDTPAGQVKYLIDKVS